jgi:hypothetical protein
MVSQSIQLPRSDTKRVSVPFATIERLDRWLAAHDRSPRDRGQLVAAIVEKALGGERQRRLR